MEISDLYVACQWAKKQFESMAVMPGNGGSGSPNGDYKWQLLNFLRNISFDGLSDQQIKILHKSGMSSYISYMGPDGASQLEENLINSANDPVTQNNLLQMMQFEWSEFLTAIYEMENGIGKLIEWGPPKEIENEVVVYLHFDGEAKISEVAELKKWSSDWYEIARGITACVDGRPEDVRIIGASIGTVILTLSVTTKVALLLAVISGSVAKILHDIHSVKMDQEVYRHKNIMNQKMEDGFQDVIDQIRSQAAKNVLNRVIGSTASELSPEIESQLNLAIEKFIVYTEKGGEIDLIAPADSKSTDNDLNVSRKEILQFKKEVRAIRSEMKRLKPPTSQS